MSAPVSGSNKSNIGWKASAIVFIFLTIGASALAYYYYAQNQNNVSNYVSKTADSNFYYSQWQSDESKISDLNQQISADNSQIASDKATISADNSQIAQLQSQVYNPACKPNCDSMITQLNGQINSLSAQIATDNSQIAADMVLIQSLNSQIANLRNILGLKLSQVFASGVTKNLPRCGETGDPSCQGSSACTNPSNCTPQFIDPSDFLTFCASSCYQGVLTLSWTSTVAMSVTFMSTYHTSSAISMSSSSTSSGNFAFPIIANFTANNGLTTSGFHNDSCTKDVSGNYHCAAVSLTYSETFDY